MCVYIYNKLYINNHIYIYIYIYYIYIWNWVGTFDYKPPRWVAHLILTSAQPENDVSMMNVLLEVACLFFSPFPDVKMRVFLHWLNDSNWLRDWICPLPPFRQTWAVTGSNCIIPHGFTYLLSLLFEIEQLYCCITFANLDREHGSSPIAKSPMVTYFQYTFLVHMSGWVEHHEIWNELNTIYPLFGCPSTHWWRLSFDPHPGCIIWLDLSSITYRLFQYFAIEHGHLLRWFTYSKWWFFIAVTNCLYVYQRLIRLI